MFWEFLSSEGEGDFLLRISVAVESDLQELKSLSGPWEQSEFFSHFYKEVCDEMILDELDKNRQEGKEQKDKKCKSPVKYKDALSAQTANFQYSSGRGKYMKSKTSASYYKQLCEVNKTNVVVELKKMEGALNIYRNRM